jgi:hypothetical protein
MPFTLSHPAAVLPLAGTGLPVAGLVAGSMAPDVPMFLPGQIGYGVTHNLVGVVTVDLLMAVVAVLLWRYVVRNALVDTAPSSVRERFPANARYTRRQWALLPAAAIVGALSHVAWDAFTHQGRWGVAHVAWLQAGHAGLPGYQWAQYASGAIGLAVVLIWAVRTVAARQRRTRPAAVAPLAGRTAPVAIGAATVVGGIGALLAVPQGFHAVAFHGAVVGTVTLALSLLGLALAWQLLNRSVGR